MCVCRRGQAELTPKEFQGSAEMPQPVPAGVCRKLRLVWWGWWGPNAAVLGPAGLHPMQLLGG